MTDPADPTRRQQRRRLTAERGTLTPQLAGAVLGIPLGILLFRAVS